MARKTTNLAERVRAVDRLSASGATSLYDAIAIGIETLGQQVGRKAMVIFSDGEDQGSHLTIEEAEQRLQASDVTLYMIGQGRGLSAEPLKRVMQRLADPTGGRALFTDSIDKLQGAFAELLVELSHQYLVWAISPPTPPETARFVSSGSRLKAQAAFAPGKATWPPGRRNNVVAWKRRQDAAAVALLRRRPRLYPEASGISDAGITGSTRARRSDRRSK